MSTTLAGPEDRGLLEINPVVLRKIIEHAADQVPGTLRHGRRLAGIDVGEVGASAKVTTAVRTVVDAVRAKVGEDLDHMAGHRVRSLTVTVAGLRSPHATAPRPR